MNRHNNQQSVSPRTAFTLIELLVAITIILILVGLLVAAIAPALTGARESATKAIIVQIDAQLKQRLSAFNTLMDNDARGTTTDTMVQMIARSYRCSEADAKVLYRKIRYRIEFPQRVADLIFNADGSKSNNDSPLRSVLEKALQISIDASTLSSVDQKVSSSELLYLLLTEGRSLGTESYSLEGIGSQYITDQDGDSLMEIRDAWGNELRFYASPTALFRPDPSDSDPDYPGLARLNLSKGARFHFANIMGDDNTNSPREGSLYQDPLDKRAALLTLWRRLNPPAADPLTRAAFYYDPVTYFSYLIVSPGSDGEPGLTEPNDASGSLPELKRSRHAQPISVDESDPRFGYMFDNLTNQNLKK